MKRVISILALASVTVFMLGQATQTMSYQALIQDRSNVLFPSTTVGLKLSVLQDSETGPAIYVETHTTRSDETGMVSFELGGGTAISGQFSDVIWSDYNYFLKTECDPTGGTNYSDQVGVSQLFYEATEEEESHFVGEYYGGGIIFHLEDEGKHGLITKTIDKSKWHHGTFTDEYTERDGPATVKFNQKRLVAIKSSKAYDAQTFALNQEGNLSQWYLPTRYDLNKLYLNRSAIGGYTAFARGWKSVKTSSMNEWFQSFVTGGSFSNGKDDVTYIRIIRNF